MTGDTKPWPWVSMRGVLLPALLMFSAVVWWAGRDAADQAASAVAATNPATASASTAAKFFWLDPASAAPITDERAAAASRPEATADASAESSFVKYVTGKYRFLEASEELRAALLARERVAVAINTANQGSDAGARESIPEHRAQLAALDQKVGTLLRASDLAAFEVLKDSDVEQFQLDDYAGGVSAIAPLSEADRKAILYTKLAHRQRFRQVLAESGLMRGDMNAAERRHAFIEVSRALGEAREHYLQEVRQYLYNDEQFALLRNYETSEYDAELEKLRGIAYAERPAALTELRE